MKSEDKFYGPISCPLLTDLFKLRTIVKHTYWNLRFWCMEIVRQSSFERTSGSCNADAMLTVMNSNAFLANNYPADGEYWLGLESALSLLIVANAGKTKPLLKSNCNNGHSTVTGAVRSLAFAFSRTVTELEAFKKSHPIPFREVRTRKKQEDSTRLSSHFELLDSAGKVTKVVPSVIEVEKEMDDWFTSVFVEWKRSLAEPAKRILQRLGKKCIKKTRYKTERGTRIVTRHRFPEWELRLYDEFNVATAFLIQNWSVLGKTESEEKASTTENEDSGLDGIVSITDIELLTPYGYSKVADDSKEWGDKVQHARGQTRHGWMYQTIRPTLLVQYKESTFPERYDDAMTLSKRYAEQQNSDGTCRGSRKLRKLKSNSAHGPQPSRNQPTK